MLEALEIFDEVLEVFVPVGLEEPYFLLSLFGDELDLYREGFTFSLS